MIKINYAGTVVEFDNVEQAKAFLKPEKVKSIFKVSNRKPRRSYTANKWTEDEVTFIGQNYRVLSPSELRTNHYLRARHSKSAIGMMVWRFTTPATNQLSQVNEKSRSIIESYRAK